MRDVFQRAMKDAFPSTTTKNDIEYNAQTFDLDERESELDCAQTEDKNERRKKKRKIVNPQKRAVTRFADDAALLQHKKQISRRKRVDESRLITPLMGSTNKLKIEFPKKMRSAGYAYQFCDKLKVQNNAQNVVQYICLKHRVRSESSINELREATLSISVSEKNREDEAKDPPILDTVEVEDNTNSAIHEESCESLPMIIPNIVIKYTKPMKTCKTRSTKDFSHPVTLVCYDKEILLTCSTLLLHVGYRIRL